MVKPLLGTISLKEYRNIRIDKIMKIRMFKQVLCKEIISTLPECFMGMVIMSGNKHICYPVV